MKVVNVFGSNSQNKKSVPNYFRILHFNVKTLDSKMSSSAFVTKEDACSYARRNENIHHDDFVILEIDPN